MTNTSFLLPLDDSGSMQLINIKVNSVLSNRDLTKINIPIESEEGV